MDSAAFARDWEAAWNAHDLDRIMAHYRVDVIFRSRKAAALMGSGEIAGKEALRHYWEAALARQPDLSFTLTEVFEGHGMLVIAYTNHRGVRAAETLYFDDEGKVFRGAACHA
ncbi:MAG: nuclear transport factor 2 family protein [Pseudomonadota bacterium]